MRWRNVVGLLLLGLALQPDVAVADWSLRLTKAPESKEWEKPAIASYTRSDGGVKSYMTQGNLSYDFTETQPFGPFSALVPSARVYWAKNTLTGQEQDSRGAAFDGTLQFAGENPQNFLSLTASLGVDRNQLKSDRSTTASLDIAAGHDVLFSALDAWPVAYAILPAAGEFMKDVTDAATDKDTGIKPTGKLRGHYGSVSATLIPTFLGGRDAESEFLRARRWKLIGSSQIERTTSVVAGDEKGLRRLHSIALGYTFADPPLVKPPKGTAQTPKVIPGLTLRRQVGSDPWNDVKKGGYTQLAFSLKY